MLSLIQRVSHAEVQVDGQVVGSIQKGILALVGMEKNDTEQATERIIDKITRYRVFSDNDGKMNLNLQQVDGGLLLVPQFTLVAETNKGTRPGFSNGMPPTAGEKLFSYLYHHAKQAYSGTVASGVFGANMQVTLCNDGPVTFMLQI